MNVAWTQAAEGFPRRAFTVEDVRRMIDAGVIGEDENFELIEGEFVMMAAKGPLHDIIKSLLAMAMVRAAPDGLVVGVENTLQLADDILVDPDICVVARSVYNTEPKGFARPTAKDALLLVEVAVSSMAYDRKVKARLYARHGIREFWVIDANERITWVHTGPSGDNWSSIDERRRQDQLITPALPGFSISLAELD
ncbi:MAG: Uma2 family endonuclease [Rhizobiales bacterium]|nr:Uma2 family endonuclease [Hyphomicrobiales bacterium]